RLIEGMALCWYDDNLSLERMLGVVLDITRVDAAHAALSRSEAQLRSVVNTAPDAVFMVNERGLISAANGAAERIFGRPSNHLIGASVEQLVPAFAAAKGSDPGRAYAGAPIEGLLGKTLTLTGIRADGSSFPIEINIDAVQCDNTLVYIGFVRDITDRVEAEQRIDAFRSEYLRIARLNAMGAVAAGLAHELNQPLAASANFLAAARLSAEAGADAATIAPLLEQAGGQITLAGDIIRRLRGFLAPCAQHVGPLQLADLIEEARALAFVGDLGHRVRIELVGSARTASIHADRVQMLQVLVNLLRNAYDAMAGMPDPLIRIATARCADKLRIAIQDVGPGFDADMLNRAGTMFASTKPDTGLGFGLSICRYMVEQWGGMLCVGNVSQGGGEVAFTVPAVDGSGAFPVDQKAGEGLVDGHQLKTVDVEMRR
ncbi:MAG: two-component system sensor histidine kinase NtrB, partial [Sphingomonas sp.]